MASRQPVLRPVGAFALALLGLLIAAALAPFALGEQRSSGSVLDTTATLTGQGQAASEGLRRIGYACSDSGASDDGVTRACTRVRLIETAKVELVVAEATGALQLVTITIDEGRTASVSHGQILEVIADALGLEEGERRTVVAAAAGNDEQFLQLSWGSFAVDPGAAPRWSELRAAKYGGAPPGLSKRTLTGSVDALATAAGRRGYRCEIPEVRTIRACTRTAGGYAYDLWMQGTDRYVTTLDLSVTAAYRTRTRSHWVDEMTVVLTWVETEQGHSLSSWLARSADAPGADSYVDGLPIYFLVRANEYTKETFGGVSAECGRTVDDISRCEP
jgi:hypothetical protein